MRAKIITYKRARGLRREMTLPEVILWSALRRGQVAGVGFQRQYPTGSYVLDFYCPSAKLAVEVDGEHHGREEQIRHDRARDAWLKSEGIEVLRIPASAILDPESLVGVIETIRDIAAPNPPPQSGGGGTAKRWRRRVKGRGLPSGDRDLVCGHLHGGRLLHRRSAVPLLRQGRRRILARDPLIETVLDRCVEGAHGFRWTAGSRPNPR